jgi:hypothetical protein
VLLQSEGAKLGNQSPKWVALDASESDSMIAINDRLDEEQVDGMGIVEMR